MKTTHTTLVAFSIAVAAASAQAQFVKGNEAVKVHPDGTRTVETPPLPAFPLASPCKAANLACTPSGWRMVETNVGLQECTEFYARPGTCRASTYGSEKRPRQWIVKLKGKWMQCERPDISSRCVNMGALPNLAVQ